MRVHYLRHVAFEGIGAGKRVLGICLGAQLIAGALVENCRAGLVPGPRVQPDAERSQRLGTVKPPSGRRRPRW